MKTKELKNTKILSLGSGFPDRVVTNFDLEKIVDTTDEWIRTRTGIHERRLVSEGENNSDCGAKAALDALKKAGKSPEDVDLIIACTNTPDRWMPSLAGTIQVKIGARPGCAAYDIVTACAGWVVGLQVADKFVATGLYKNVLVVGSEALSRFMDWSNRNTCVLFGDGAGASLITAAEPGEKSEIIDVRVQTDGRYGDILELPSCATRTPVSIEALEKKLNFIHMNGPEVYKHAVRNMASICEEILADNKLTINDIDWLIPHQANIRIIEAVGKKLGVAEEKVALNVHKYGNTSAATIPTCFDEYTSLGKIKRGDLILMTSFGGGLTWGGALVRW